MDDSIINYFFGNLSRGEIVSVLLFTWVLLGFYKITSNTVVTSNIIACFKYGYFTGLLTLFDVVLYWPIAARLSTYILKSLRNDYGEIK